MIEDCKLKYKVLKIISPVELKKIKKEFLNFCKLRPPKEKASFGDAYLEFLNNSVSRDE